MHCVAGDGVGILAVAVIASLLYLGQVTDIALEYALGFAFGWSIFQALFMRAMAGGSYKRSLTSTFFPELLSMNCLMAGMVPAMTLALKAVPGSREPSRPEFWFIMSMALLVGFVTAYPMNWWLVSQHLKHGMMTVRPPDDPLSGGAASASMHDDHAPSTGHADKAQPKGNPPMDSDAEAVSNGVLAGMTLLSFGALGIGLSIAVFFGGS